MYALNWSAIALTLQLAALTSAILVAIGLPIAYWISYSRWKWKFLIESVVALPLVLPPTVLGFYVLIAIGPRAMPGRFYERLMGHQLPFTFEGLLIASVQPDDRGAYSVAISNSAGAVQSAAALLSVLAEDAPEFPPALSVRQ